MPEYNFRNNNASYENDQISLGFHQTKESHDLRPPVILRIERRAGFVFIVNPSDSVA